VKVWRLKKGADRRLRQGHPWVFASELAHSAKEITPGEVVELRDSSDHFLAYGYGHPSSQICFRKLSSRSKDSDVLSVEFFVARLKRARELRAACAWTGFSHRWLYAEADGVPGLIIDTFLSDGRWVTVVQASTAGAERALPQVYAALAEFGEMTVVEAPSSRARVLEGLAVSEKRVIRGSSEGLERLRVSLIEGLNLQCDFLGGQKTGFFLDQQWNATLLRRGLRQFKAEAPVRVLDICCYVGQWASHSVAALRDAGVRDVEAHLLDSSASALALAAENVRAVGGRAEVVEGDALKILADLPAESFDVVICDPPAFVKKKADLESGLRAYAKLNRDAMRLVRPGAWFVASSCSGLVKSADFQRALLEASAKAGRMFRQLEQGGHGPDHPLRPEFPEGEYLKCLLGQIDYPF
jgi:23S rRNA (cytosine1962-C5)-methyltransferase